jgi:uncharacterized protein (TIGR00106 family)
MLFFFSVAPMDRAEGMSELVAQSLDLIDKSGLPYKLGPMGTTVEGDWDEVMDLIKRCHMQMRAQSARVSTSIKIDDHVGATGRLAGKVAAVEMRLGRELSK